MENNSADIRKAQVILLDKFIRESSSVAVIGHLNPDGDSVGSAVAMCRYVKSLGIECTPILPSISPANLNFLDPSGEMLFFSVKEPDSEKKASQQEVTDTVRRADLIICIDFNNLKRTEGMEPILRETSCRKVLIDHHPDPETDVFDLVFSDTSISSACELLFWILMDMPGIDGDCAKIGKSIAEPLAAGMITDTNNFSNSVVSSTFTMASHLMNMGIDLEAIYSRVFGNYSENRMKLMGEMLSGMEIDRETHSACMVLTRELQQKFGFVSGDSEGFVNLGLKVSDVETSALFTEEPDRIRVSLRSKGNISVNRLSRSFFNGGGHERASGGRLEMPIGQVRDYYHSSLRQFIRKEGISFASKALSVFIAVLTLSVSVVFTSCSKNANNTYNSQEESISKYIKTNFTDKDTVVVKRNGSYRAIINKGYGTDSLTFGDSVYFYYAGYIFSNGPSSIFATNRQEVAEKNNFLVTRQEDTYDVLKVRFESNSFIPGLTDGLYGMKEKEHSIVVFSARYGFGKQSVANIPALSALCYEIWIDRVIKEK